MIKKIKGNIFNTSCQVLVNTVNCVGIMGKGIALECKLRFPDMFEKYKEFCEKKLIKPGVLQIWSNSKPWILNFPTKAHWKDPSKIEYLEKGLDKFKNEYSKKNITSIAFPLLGASLGGLSEELVYETMIKHLEPLKNIDIEIYEYDANAGDDLFDLFHQKVWRFSVDDYKKNLKINKIAAENLKRAIDEKNVKSMLGIQDLPQVGLKAIESIHEFTSSKENIMIQSQLDIF
jgi:O-acetyl-ADP-ribose deacetylase (regulator of RNase III)